MESPPSNRLFSRIREAARHLLRRQPPPAMIGTPPSQRPTWHDPAAHARDFAERYATELDYAVSQRMIELGIPDDRIGTRNFGYGPPRLAFQPFGVDGGHIESNGEILVDSGLLNDELLTDKYGKKAAAFFKDSSLRHRLDAIIAHEYEEHRNGMDHEAAVKVARDTKLPISNRARRILEEMRKGWRGR
jgi:hypothetical protein